MNRVVLALSALIVASAESFAGENPIWRWHEADSEIYSASFSPDGAELAMVRQRHLPDGHEAEELEKAEVEKRFQPLEKNERYADPEVVVLKIGDKTAAPIDWGWSPEFSPDGTHIAYAHQKKPISRLRVLAETLAGNDIRLFRRDTKATKILATAVSGYLANPLFAPDGKQIVYSLADAVNGAWGGEIGIGRVSIDGTANETLYPPSKDFELYHLVDSKRYVGGRLVALRSKPTSGGMYLADSYAYELLDIGPPAKSIYTWPKENDDSDPRAFAASAEGEVLVFDRNWRKASADAKSDRKSAEAGNPGVISPNGRILAVAAKSGIQLRDFRTGKVLTTLNVKGGPATVTWSPDSRRLAVVVTRYRKGSDEVFDHDEIAVYAVAHP